MSLKDYIVNIDIIRENANTINCKQYDNGTNISLVFTRTEDFIDLENYTVIVYFQLPNKEEVNKVCTINNNMANFIIDNEITNIPGKINTEIVLESIDEEISLDILTINVKESFRRR